MYRSRIWSRRAASAVLSMAGAIGAHAAVAAPALPKGWHALPLPTVTGAFRQAGTLDTAVLAQNGRDGAYGLVIVPAGSGGEPVRIVKTFHDIATNPPVLSLARPGSYRPACHAGGACEPVAVANEAVNLCFGEAGCDIVYYDGSGFRDMAVTD